VDRGCRRLGRPPPRPYAPCPAEVVLQLYRPAFRVTANSRLDSFSGGLVFALSSSRIRKPSASALPVACRHNPAIDVAVGQKVFLIGEPYVLAVAREVCKGRVLSGFVQREWRSPTHLPVRAICGLMHVLESIMSRGAAEPLPSRLVFLTGASEVSDRVLPRSSKVSEMWSWTRLPGGRLRIPQRLCEAIAPTAMTS